MAVLFVLIRRRKLRSRNEKQEIRRVLLFCGVALVRFFHLLLLFEDRECCFHHFANLRAQRLATEDSGGFAKQIVVGYLLALSYDRRHCVRHFLWADVFDRTFVGTFSERAEIGIRFRFHFFRPQINLSVR